MRQLWLLTLFCSLVIAPGTANALIGVQSKRKISDLAGGFTGTLKDGDRWGLSVVSLGDLDGDGNPDLAVGAPGDDDGGTSRGAIWVLFLRADGSVRAHQKISDGMGGFGGALSNADQFGISIATLGDLDGDGNVDLAVGAHGDDDGGSGRGAVWILFLDTDGTVKGEAKLSALAGGFAGALDNGDAFGRSLALLGDLDGDGTVELAVGALGDDDGGSGRGALWIVSLDGDGGAVAEQKISQLAGGFGGALDNGGGFGISAAALGDLDGDQVPDLIVGEYSGNDGGGGRGAVWILFLETDGSVGAEQKISDTAGGFAGTLADGDNLGRSVARLGDLENDGSLEIAVGAHGDNEGGPNRGAIWLLSLDHDGTVLGEQKIAHSSGGLGNGLGDHDIFGVAGAGPGDLDDDGFADVVVGAADDDDGGPARGAIYALFLGPPVCSDGVDNDNDGDVDFPADEDCTQPFDKNEACGFGAELVLLVPLWTRLRRARRRR